MADFEPKIVAMLCRWCSSAGADLAGVSRMKYPVNIRPIRVTCSGRMDPLFILRALEAGADGIFLGACHPGDCHYVDGNYKAKKRFDFFMKILKEFGLDERVTMQYVSASEGMKFTKVTKEFTDKVRKLGPSPIGKKRVLTDLVITETRRKKHVMHDIINSLAEAVNFQLDPTRTLEIAEEEVMEGWGFPRRDPDKCVGCYACYNKCPEQVITMNDVENKRIYGTLSHNCINCRDCEDVCPHDAIEVIPGFDFISYMAGTPVEDISHELLACSKCNEFFAPVAFVNHVEKTIRNSSIPKKLKIPENQLKLCPECKRKEIANNIQLTRLKQASFLTSRRSE